MYFQGPLNQYTSTFAGANIDKLEALPYPKLGGISSPGHLVKEGDSVQRLLNFLTPGLCARLCLLCIGSAGNIRVHTGVFSPRLIRDMRAGLISDHLGMRMVILPCTQADSFLLS